MIEENHTDDLDDIDDIDDVAVQLNCRGMNCPLPFIYVRKEMKKLKPGELLLMLATDPKTIEDMDEFTAEEGYTLVDSGEEAGDFIFLLRKEA